MSNFLKPPPATLIFRNKDRIQSEVDFADWKSAILAAVEQLTPKERASAFIYSGKTALNTVEIQEKYRTLTAA